MFDPTTAVIVGIDPGTACGWAVRHAKGHMQGGIWDLKPRRYEGGGMRFVRLAQYLRELCASELIKVSLMAFEEVRHHKGVDAAHIYGGIVAHIAAHCDSLDLPYYGIPVGTVKKFAMGKGNANKELMLEAAKAKWPDAAVIDHNQADAMWIAECAWAQLKGEA